ncbi:MAG: hypothetical protein J3Q66DRAFT_393088 [Benniella sp.]|nr:MAG: hypothetical protein J3Q66DRAFT_393088 [Benniella sp.]
MVTTYNKRTHRKQKRSNPTVTDEEQELLSTPSTPLTKLLDDSDIDEENRPGSETKEAVISGSPKQTQAYLFESLITKKPTTWSLETSMNPSPSVVAGEALLPLQERHPWKYHRASTIEFRRVACSELRPRHEDGNPWFDYEAVAWRRQTVAPFIRHKPPLRAFSIPYIPHRASDDPSSAVQNVFLSQAGCSSALSVVGIFSFHLHQTLFHATSQKYTIYQPQPRPQTAASSPLPPLPTATAIVESGSVGVKIGMFSCSLKTSEDLQYIQPKVHHQRRLRIIVAVDYHKSFRLATTAAVMRHIEGAEKPPSSVNELSLSTNYEMAAWTLIALRPCIWNSPSTCLLGTTRSPLWHPEQNMDSLEKRASSP